MTAFGFEYWENDPTLATSAVVTVAAGATTTRNAELADLRP